MENNIIKLTNKEYRFDIDCNVTKLTINVDDNSAIIVKGYDEIGRASCRERV